MRLAKLVGRYLFLSLHDRVPILIIYYSQCINILVKHQNKVWLGFWIRPKTNLGETLVEDLKGGFYVI
jgi:hypothetical protein